MDPDANHEEQVRLALDILKCVDEGKRPDAHDAVRLAELVIALNDWVGNGGSWPTK